MNKKFGIFILILLFLLQSVHAQVMISQVLYDPSGTESGGEAIELQNIGNDSLDISGLTIRTESSAADATIPDSTILYAQQKYLIADTGWNEKKDDSSWRSADTEQAITLKNSDSGVGLFNGSTLLDAVGWGEVSDPLLFVGDPAVAVQAGLALHRINNTGNNIQDFVGAAADFSLTGGLSEHVLDVIIVVEDNSLYVGDVMMVDDDLSAEGIQLIPSLGATREVDVLVNINSSTNVTVTATFLNQSFALQKDETGNYIHSLLLHPDLLAGTYAIAYVADNGIEQQTFTQEIELLSVIGFEVSTQELNLSTDATFTITNIGNVAIDLGIKGTDFISAGLTLPVDVLSVIYDEVDQPAIVRSLSSILEILNTDIMPAANSTLSLQLDLPNDAAAGTYAGSVTVVGVAN